MLKSYLFLLRSLGVCAEMKPLVCCTAAQLLNQLIFADPKWPSPVTVRRGPVLSICSL